MAATAKDVFVAEDGEILRGNEATKRIAQKDAEEIMEEVGLKETLSALKAKKVGKEEGAAIAAELIKNCEKEAQKKQEEEEEAANKANARTPMDDLLEEYDIISDSEMMSSEDELSESAEDHSQETATKKKKKM